MPERRRMTTRLKALFQRPALFVLAGGINPIGAKMAEALGYEAFYMSGGNTSAHQLGWPDSGTSMRDISHSAPFFAVPKHFGEASCRRRGRAMRGLFHALQLLVSRVFVY